FVTGAATDLAVSTPGDGSAQRRQDVGYVLTRRHRVDRCGVPPLTGSCWSFRTKRFWLAPASENGSKPGRPSSGHASHQPCEQQTTPGMTASVTCACAR